MSLSICKDCDQPCQNTGKPCKKVEKILKKEGIYSRDWIRPKMPSDKRKNGQWREIPMSSLNTKGRKEANISQKYGSME
jgi:hypothetical protein